MTLNIEKFPNSLTPPEAFGRLKREKNSFLLESSFDPGGLGRFSFLGGNPFLTLKSKGRELEIIEAGKGRKCFEGNPFEVMRELLVRYRVKSSSKLPPFTGGALGYFGYDLCHFIEKLPARSEDDLKLPDCYLAFYDSVYIFDHQEEQGYISSTGFQKNAARDLQAKLMAPEEVENSSGEQTENVQINSNFTKKEYLQAVGKAKDYIAAGDIYQVNLSQRFTAPARVSPRELYRRLRKLSPAPFSSFFDFGEGSIVSSSPERFLSLRGRQVETRPMKGTRPRGESKQKDTQMQAELMASEKDKAELIMIVDLERNDLGRVCEYGSVHLKEARTLESYATVFQTTATVRGILEKSKDRIDLLKATFPGGSVTGVPKVRAMEIIDELEPTRRGPYTGSLGYLSFTGEMDLNILIRTFLIKENQVYFQVGGGIVADSEAEAEYQETLDKARALMQSLNV